MITCAQTDFLLLPATRDTIERNIGEDPVRVALSAGDNSDLIATQVKYLQRSRMKLPSWYEKRCIIEPLAFEQCSSEAAAAAKNFSGGLCIDLTCGLGVDSYYFSKNFERVISVEKNHDLCRIVESNMQLLGAGNIELINTSAEEFISGFDGRADLIYIDPARRDNAGGKQYLLEYCTPNVLEMKDKLLSRTKLLVIKASPLFDADEAFRLFGNGITVEVVSVNGECKELLIIIDTDAREGDGKLRATRAGSESIEFPAGSSKPEPKQGTEPESKLGSEGKPASEPKIKPGLTEMQYLLIPDVSLYKIRKVHEYAASNGFFFTSANGYLFSASKPSDFFGQVRRITDIVPYRPKQIKNLLKERGINRATILKKDFPYSTEKITEAIKIKEGGSTPIAFTLIYGQPYALILAN